MNVGETDRDNKATIARLKKKFLNKGKKLPGCLVDRVYKVIDYNVYD